MELDSFGIPMLMEMARVWPDDSGLEVSAIILNGENLPHGPRIKVSTIKGGKVDKDHLISVTVDDDPKVIGSHKFSADDLNKIFQFVKLNKQTLHDHYYGKISDKQALNQLVKV